MESKSILVGIVIGIIVGSFLGFMAVPSPDVSVYENQITQLESQATSLQNEIDRLEDKLEDAISQADYNTLEQQVTQLQSQVSSLQNQLSDSEDENDDLEDQIQSLQDIFNYTPGDWNIIKIWSGSAERTTELFYVPSNQIRISWDLDPDQYSSFTIFLYKDGDEYLTDGWLSLEDQPQGETYAYISPGNYYLELSVYSCDYTVTVEAQIP